MRNELKTPELYRTVSLIKSVNFCLKFLCIHVEACFLVDVFIAELGRGTLKEKTLSYHHKLCLTASWRSFLAKCIRCQIIVLKMSESDKITFWFF